MAKRVTQVQKRAVALFGFIARDNLGLHFYGPPHGFDTQGGITGSKRRAVLFKPLKERDISKHPVLHDLAEPGAERGFVAVLAPDGEIVSCVDRGTWLASLEGSRPSRSGC